MLFMRNDFPLFRSHLELAKSFWERLVAPGDRVLDGTCGNGQDTLFLAQLGAQVVSFDIQERALEKAKQRLPAALSENVQFVLGSHAELPEELRQLRLAVYNLGYLPGGEKSVVTQTESTLTSVREAMERLLSGGAVSITCYPGHEEGAREEAALLQFGEALDPGIWSLSHTRWINRRRAPSFLLIQKALDSRR